MSNHSGGEDPLNGSSSEDILVVPNEINFLPNIAEEIINILLTKVISTVEPVRAENANLEVDDFASLIEWLESVVKRRAVVPFEVIFEDAELVLDDVEVAAIGPVVP